MQPSLRTLGRRAFTRRDEHSGFNLLQAAVLEGDDDTVTKASLHLENFVEEMNCRTTGEKASIFPGKSAADILSVRSGKFVKVSTESFETRKTLKSFTEFVETQGKLTKLHSRAKGNDVEMAIELVLNDGIDVNVAEKRNITPLVWASPAVSSLSIKTLIDLGADVNAQTSLDRIFAFAVGPHFFLQSMATMQMSLNCYLLTRRILILLTFEEIQFFIHQLPRDFSTFPNC